VREQLAWSKEGVLVLIGAAFLGVAVAGFARKELAE
jgi:hypothetical protein